MTGDLRERRPAAQHYELTPVADGTGGLIDSLLSGRRQSLEEQAVRLAALVAERQTLRDGSLAAINYDQIVLCNLVHALYRPGVPPTENRDYIKLRLEQLRLEKERRQEIVSAWRDTVDLGRDMAQLRQKVEEARRNEGIFQGELL